ncbi:urease accessory protein, partial [Streptomyces sp. NPDC059802]
MYRDESDLLGEPGRASGEAIAGTPAAEPALGPLLVSLQLTDSAFPSGFYTLSHSLEGFAHAGAVDRESLPLLLEDLLLHGVGPADATALALALRASRAGDAAA